MENYTTLNLNFVIISSQTFPEGMAGTKRIRSLATYLSSVSKVHVLINRQINQNNPVMGNYGLVSFSTLGYNKFEMILNKIRKYEILKSTFVPEQKNILIVYDGISINNLQIVRIARKMGFYIFADIVEDYSLHKENVSFALNNLHKINKVLEKKSAQYFHGVIVISENLKKKFRSLGFSDSRIHLMPVSAENLELNFDTKNNLTPTFVYAGSFGNKDGIGFLLNAFIKVSSTYNHIKLRLSGTITPNIMEQIKNHPEIEYSGLIPDKDFYNYLSNADVLVMNRVNTPYANSGFPFKLGEYLATGKPVIATKVGDITNYLTDKLDVILAEPESVESLAEAFKFTLDKPEQCKIIGENGKKNCKKNFNPQINGSKTLEFIKELINA